MESTPASEPLTPPLEALYWTQYGQWYPLFRKHAPKSTVIDIRTVQPELLDWLHSDTFILPSGSGPSTLPAPASITTLSEAGSSKDGAESDDEDEEAEMEVVELGALDAAIRAVVERYEGGPVFPKLTWSAPLDASFMLAGNNLQCRHPEDVYLLLKSSEFVARDLEQIAQTQTPTAVAGEDGEGLEVRTRAGVGEQVDGEMRVELVLKKWFNIARSYELRCFVRAGQLIALCQRDMTFYDHLQDAPLQDQLREGVCRFWSQVVKTHDGFPLRDYVLDVYVTKDLGRVWIIDINAWLPRTDPLLYTFDDLELLHRSHTHNTQPQFRVLTDKRLQSTGGTGATYSSNMVPTDLVDFAKSSARSTSSAPPSVDQIVADWNAHVDAQDAHPHA